MLFPKFLEQKPVLILDGAMGTELQRNGVDISLPLWSAGAILRAPHVVRNIHYWYLHAGADILTTNTFRTNLRSMRRAGMEDRWEEMNLRAVQFAFEARDRYRSSRPVFIAGGMAPVEDSYSPDLVPSDSELQQEHSRQAQLLAGIGVDLLLVETMTVIREAAIAADACSTTGIPFAVSLVCSGDGRLLSGESLEEAAAAIAPHGPSALLVNCMSIVSAHECWRRLADATDVPTGCYANVGEPPSGAPSELDYDTDIQGFIDETLRIADSGARIVGGCCGTTPDHIRGIAQQLCPSSLEVEERPNRRAIQNEQRENQ